MQLINKCNKGIRFLLCAIDIFSKYAWVFPLKNKKAATIVNAFQSILDNSERKLNTYFESIKAVNSIASPLKMFSIHKEETFVVAERFIRTLKNEIYKQMAAMPKNVYFDLFDDIVGKYNNTYHTTIKMNPIVVKSGSYAKDAKFKKGNHVRISKHENIFVEGYAPKWSEKDFVIRKVRNTLPWTYVINHLN